MLTEKTILRVHAHQFFSPVGIKNPNAPTQPVSDNLGTEIDLSLMVSPVENAKFHFGYSQLFATPSMNYIKQNLSEVNLNNNWFWFMMDLSLFLIMFLRPKLNIFSILWFLLMHHLLGRLFFHNFLLF